MSNDEKEKKTHVKRKGPQRRRSSTPRIVRGISSVGTGGQDFYPEEMTLAERLETLKPHDHLCLIYESKKEWRAAVIPFLAIGLERGEKCVYITDTSTADEIRTYLGKEGIDVSVAEKRSQLGILQETDAYTMEGSFDPDKMIAFLISETEKAVAEGYPALRVTGEMTWVLRGYPGSEKLLEYEAKLNRDLFPRYPCLAICQYDRWKFDPEIIKGIIVTHPILIRGNRLFHNFYYIPPEDFLNQKRAEMEAQHWLNNIEREQRIWQKLIESREKYIELIDNLNSGMAVYKAVDDGRDFVFADLSRAGEKIDNLSRDKVIGKSVLEVFPGIKEFGLFDVLQRVWRTGRPEHHPVTRYEDDRISGWRDNYVYKLLGGEIVAIYNDVTELKKVQAELSESEEKYRNLVERAGDGICIIQDKLVKYANLQQAKMWGGSIEEIINTPFINYIHPDELPVVIDRYNRRMTGEQVPSAYEAALRRKDGSKVYAELNIGIINYMGKPAELVITRDITKRKQAEEELRQIHETAELDRNRLHVLLETIPSGVVVIEKPNGRITYVNERALVLYGMDPSGSVMDKHSTDVGLYQMNGSIYPPEKLPASRALLHGETVHSEELIIKRPDGTQIVIAASAAPLRDADGNIYAAVGVFDDITERQQAEEILQESEKRFRAIFDHTTDGIILADLESETIYGCNESMCRLLGYSMKELQSMKIADLHPKEALPYVMEQIGKQARGEFSLVSDIPFKRKDGSAFYTEISSALITFTGRTYLAGICRDITERKQAEEALQKSEERFRMIAETSPDYIIQTDTSGKILYASPVCKRIVGYAPEELMNRTYSDFIPPSNLSTVQALLAEAVAGTTLHNVETEILHKNGNAVPVEASIAPQIVNGKVMSLYAVIRDITDRKQAERERERSAKLESIGTLAGGIAHDFNNLLAGIMGNISMARREVEPKGKAMERLEEAEKASIKARDLTRQLLTFSRGGTPVKAVISIGKLIQESARFILRGSNVKPEFSLADDLWAITADEGQINQVIGNIIINAYQAMPQGGKIDIEANNFIIGRKGMLPLPTGNYVHIAITDRGIGIPREHLGRIFEPFFTTKQIGSGLGLATVYSIVKNHDGYIEVESNSGTGTTVHVYLPASEEPAPAEEAVAAETALRGKGRILVIDDEEIIREMLNKMLILAGYEVELTQDGAEAIERYVEAKGANRPFDAVIMDLTIPGGMGGKETIARLLEIDRDVKVIVSSGYATDPIVSEYKKYGFRAVVTKPYSVATIEKALYGLLGKK